MKNESCCGQDMNCVMVNYTNPLNYQWRCKVCGHARTTEGGIQTNKPLKEGIIPPEENQVVIVSCSGKKMDFATTYQGTSYYIWLFEGSEIQVNYLDKDVLGSKDIPGEVKREVIGLVKRVIFSGQPMTAKNLIAYRKAKAGPKVKLTQEQRKAMGI